MKMTLALLSFVLPTALFAACPQGTTLKGQLEGMDLCALKGKYLNSELLLTANNRYLIEDGVFFGGDNKENSTLRIQAGTTLHGNPGAFIAILRGSKIFAEGTETKPVVFTSLKLTNRKRGEWGGLVINGNAPINACKPGASICEAISEGIKVEPVKFGGNNAEDNSGVLRYVRVEFAGYPISQDNELNGITFNAVGAGTEIDFIQVNMNADDGIEFFGGTANAKHVVLTNNEDDSLDWDMGFNGKIQFMIVEQANDSADNGIEADNLKSPMNAQPRSNPTLSNVTFLGGKNSAYGMLLRKGTSAHVMNTIITGFGKACINIDDAETFNHGGLKIENTLVDCANNFAVDASDPWSIAVWFNTLGGNMTVPAQLNGWFPGVASPARGAGVTPEDLFFDPVDYLGAFADVSDVWAMGWTSNVLE